MKNLKRKSENSRKAAELLASKGLDCNCVQSYYYSMLQLSKVVLIKYKYSDCKTLDSFLKKNRNTHATIISETCSIVKNRSDNSSRRAYYESVHAAKVLRVRAAYSNRFLDKNVNIKIKELHELCCEELEKVLA